MTFLHAVTASLFLLGAAAAAAAQPGAAYVKRDKVDAALAKGGAVFDAPQARASGFHRDKPGSLDMQKGTTIIYVTDGEGIFAAGARTQRLTKGDVLVVPAGTPQAFTSGHHRSAICPSSFPCSPRTRKLNSFMPTTTRWRQR